MHRYLTGALALVLATPALAQTAGQEDAENERSSTENAPIIVTAARTQLPASALPRQSMLSIARRSIGRF